MSGLGRAYVVCQCYLLVRVYIKTKRGSSIIIMVDEGMCMICLEAGPDTAAPCLDKTRSSSTCLQFHSKCLDMMWSVQREQGLKRMCPHCNLHLLQHEEQGIEREVDTMIYLAWHRIQGMLQQWLQKKDFWISPPHYVVTKHGLMTHTESLRLMMKLQNEIILFLKQQNHSEMKQLEHLMDDTESLWICYHTDLDNSIKTTVSLARTAIVDSSGSFLQDGYSVMAERKRFIMPRASK